ncbi:MAG: DUF6318 family protein [Aeromicrobium sp.]
MRKLALAITALLLICSCGEPEPIEPPTSEAPSDAAPTMPTEAAETTPEGQVEFVRHVVSTLNYAVNSGSFDALEPLFDPACEACATYVSKVRKDNAGKGRIAGFRWRVAKGEVLDGGIVEASIDASGYRKADPETGEITKVEPASYRLGFKLRSRHNQWRVEELFVPSAKQ